MVIIRDKPAGFLEEHEGFTQILLQKEEEEECIYMFILSIICTQHRDHLFSV